MAGKSDRPSAKKKKQPAYSEDRLTKDLTAVRAVYDNLGRDRFAIHKYWKAVYQLRWKWRILNKNGITVASMSYARKLVTA